MASSIRFVIFECPDNAKKIELEIAPGTTKKELAEQCAAAQGVTATAKQIFVTNCIVDGKYQPESYVFQGTERDVLFMQGLVGG